jgi:hypothetical protein
MKYIFFIVAIFQLSASCLSAQDIITKNSGKRIDCRIINEDSLNIYYSTGRKNHTTDTYLSKSEIKNVKYITRLPYTSASDSIIIRENRMYHKGYLLTDSYALTALMKTNDEAYMKYKSSVAPGMISYFLSYMGGFFIGWQIGTAMGGGDPNWGVAGIGAGLIIVAIPIKLGSVKKQLESVDIYNRGARHTSHRNTEFNAGFTGNKLMFCVKF